MSPTVTVASSAPTVPDIDTPTETTPSTSDGSGDHDRFAHYVAKDKLTQALVEGTSVIALCGKRWVPTRDPERFPVCPTCKDIYNGLSDTSGTGGED